MSVLWTSDDAARATGGTLNGPTWTATGVSIDTRTLQPGDLFVALKDVRDGHEFVAAALEKGAAAALVNHRPDGGTCGDDAGACGCVIKEIPAGAFVIVCVGHEVYSILLPGVAHAVQGRRNPATFPPHCLTVLFRPVQSTMPWN